MTPRPPQHEFTKEENEILDDLATWSGSLGGVKIVQSILGVLGSNLIGAVLELVVGISLLGARKSLRSAVQTQGNDVDHVMIAVDKLSTVFSVRLVMSLVVAALIAIAILVITLLIAAGETIDLGNLT